MPQCVESGIEGYICDVFTLKEYRKKGIQTNLIKECIKFAKENNIIELKLSSDNLEAIRIYQRQGFEYDKLIMKKEIKLLENIGLNVEDKDYSKEELRKYEVYIEEYIMSHSSKNGDISRLSNQYNSILNTLVKENLN